MATNTATTILNLRRPAIWGQFKRLHDTPLPREGLTPEEAWRQGLKAGFGQGLIFGVNLGLEVSGSFGPEFDFKDVV